MADKYPCLACKKDVATTMKGNYRTHTDGEGAECGWSAEPIPNHLLAAGPVEPGTDPSLPREGVDFGICPECGRKVRLDDRGNMVDHTKTLRGKEGCPLGGDTPMVYAAPAVSGAPTETPSPESSSTSSDSPGSTASTARGSSATPVPADSETPDPSLGPFVLGRSVSERFKQPGSPFLQPPPYGGPVKAAPMSDRGKEIATRLKEIFYSYSNRNTSDNRSAQTTLGPSEIGTPCDRRLAMSLMGVEPTNPGGDGWAAFVGTAIHASLDDMFTWASAGSGRFETEMKLSFGSPLVPKGTGDLLDRTLMMFLDHKCMGEYSLKKLRADGPSETYRVQIHTYAYGAILAGEKVKDVAIIGWPRAGSSLDGLYVWTEPYNKQIALDALARVERIHAKTREIRRVDGLGDTPSAMATAQTFEVSTKYECKFCPFSLPNDKQMERGCPGPQKES